MASICLGLNVLKVIMNDLPIFRGVLECHLGIIVPLQVK